MKTTRSRLSVAIALAFLLGGCMVGPNYQRPPPASPMPAQYKELAGWKLATPADAVPKGDWWVDFHDPLIDELEPLVAVSNQTVRADAANYEQALALVKEARSALFPTIGIGASADRSRAPGGAAVAGSSVSSAGALEGTASWAPDLWGKVRRTVEENAANAQASEATLANATLSAQAALASAIINLRITDADIDLLQSTVTAYRESLRITQNQSNAGTVSPSDVIAARTLLESTQASLIDLGIARAQYAHAIAVLVGKNPEELDLPHSTRLPDLPSVPPGLPSTLLERRPDIAAQERSMAAQNAAIGVAVAAYYPSLTLSAAAGFSQSPLSGLFHIANYVWSLGAAASETLFDAGARKAEVAAAKAAYDAAVANYRGSVLTALQQVEDNLSGLRILAQQAEVQDSAVRNATRGTEITLNQYQAGTVDYTTVVTAQVSELTNRQNALNVQQQRLLDTVALISDLGGGWSASELKDPRHPEKP